MNSESEPAIQDLADRLIASSIWRKLPGRAVRRDVSTLDRDQYFTLINRASILALDPSPKARTLAYEIATHSLALRDKASPELVAAVDLLLARLGNFPGRQLLRARYPHAADTRKPPSLCLEAFAREVENTIPEFERPLTDFQLELLRDLSKEKAVSVSAPTSAGKSFVLCLRIIRQLRAKTRAQVAYVVPTRALIREVMVRLRQEFEKSGLLDVSIRCVPQPAKPEDTANGVVYVLTQERLLSLLHASELAFGLDLLVVDEAHGIGEGARGILLQTAVENALRRSPGAEVVFASPMIANPDEFLRLFSGNEGGVVNETHSPVAQNYILVDRLRREPHHVHFTLLRQRNRIPLGVRQTEQTWTGSAIQRRAQLAALVTNETDGCLVYANGAWEAEHLAAEVARFRRDDMIATEVQEFIEYVGDQVHPEYPLIAALKCGVGFHHGEMPPSVRAGVEDLFRARKLQFICCTSTLLQGVNLPARHLVVEKPRRGNGRPLGQAEFINLAGRAGRLLREFHGNVWCLSPDEWPSPPQDQTEQAVVSPAFTRTLAQSAGSFSEALANDRYVDRSGAVTASIGRILTEYVFTGSNLPLPEQEPARTLIAEAFLQIKDANFRLPQPVFARNSSVLPAKLERLYDALSAEADLDPWLPCYPYAEDCFERLERIFKLLQEVLESRPGLGYRFDAVLAMKWMRQHNLRQIIEARRKWQEENRKTLTPIEDVIRNMIRSIEQRIRFKLVRSLRAYHDVLSTVLIARNRASEAETMLPLHLYMECGACSQVALNLISLGFSRTAALLLYNLRIFPQDASPELCRQIILHANLEELKVPATVRREARHLLGPSQHKGKRR